MIKQGWPTYGTIKASSVSPQFLEANSQVRDNWPSTKTSGRGCVTTVLCCAVGPCRSRSRTQQEQSPTLPVVTIPDIGRSIYALHATVGKHVGRNKTKKLVTVLCFRFWGSPESSMTYFLLPDVALLAGQGQFSWDSCTTGH